MTWLKPITLDSAYCTLQPLSHDHHNALIATVQDGELWKLWYTLIPEPQKMSAEIDRRLKLQKDGSMLPFVILHKATDKVVGMTTYLNADQKNCRLKIGGTWLCKSMQRNGINTEAKLLLLTHAFESIQCHAVEFRTHFFNHQSRKGIERLGAKLDGVLRNHMLMPNNTLRDTCVYSIISNEWPNVKNHLNWLLHSAQINDKTHSLVN